jgi:long-chain acyl-CoA synthetase
MQPGKRVAWNSLPQMMLELAAHRQDQPMLRHWREGAWRRVTWGEFAHRVAAVAAGLRAAGVSPGDRVMLVSENRPEFVIADTAVMAIGAVTVPTYTTNTPADHAHILRDSGARAAIVSASGLVGKVLAGAAAAGGLDLLVGMESPSPLPDGPRVMRWAELEATPGDLGTLRAEVEGIPPGRLACLVYTSGTGGAPKGVMLPHRAMLSNREGVAQLADRLHLEGACYLSFLPLSHSYEHTVGGFLLPSLGVEVVYSRGADRLAAEFQEIGPAIVTAVPRLFEVLRGRLLAGVEKEGGWKERLFHRAVALGLRRMDGPPLGPLEKLQDAVLERLVRDKVRQRFGGKLQALVSGGARLDPDLSGFFLALGLPVIQGYGQTEAGPVVSVNVPWDNRRDTVGPPLPGVEVRIAGDGELCVRGALVMDGYWNQPEATAQAIRPAPGAAPGGRPLAAHRRRRGAGGWAHPHHRPQARLHQDARRRHGEPRQAREPADGRAGDRAGRRRRRGQTRDRRPRRPGGRHGGQGAGRGGAGERPARHHRAHPPHRDGARLHHRERAAHPDHEGEAPRRAGGACGGGGGALLSGVAHRSRWPGA